MLAALRRIPEHDRAIRAARWPRGPARRSRWELTGATVGLVGFGAIGRLVAGRLAGFGVRAARHRSGGRDVAPGRSSSRLDDLLGASDVVSLHAPLTTRPGT